MKEDNIEYSIFFNSMFLSYQKIQMSRALEATKGMCFLCFESLENMLRTPQSHIVSNAIVPKDDTTKCPMFVTWKKNGDLRGCIGNFSDLPLYDGLKEYAVVAGSRDPRFPRINQTELPSLKCGVSLLHSFEPAKDVMDWTPGKHGIRLSVDGNSSTFLPEVATEQGWDKLTTLKYLARKGGFRGDYDQAAQARSSLQRYQSSKIEASWDEYQNFLKTLH